MFALIDWTTLERTLVGVSAFSRGRPTWNLAIALAFWTVLPGGHPQCFRLSRGEHLYEEPVPAFLLWRGLFADRVAHYSPKLVSARESALEKKAWRGSREPASTLAGAAM